MSVGGVGWSTILRKVYIVYTGGVSTILLKVYIVFTGGWSSILHSACILYTMYSVHAIIAWR